MLRKRAFLLSASILIGLWSGCSDDAGPTGPETPPSTQEAATPAAGPEAAARSKDAGQARKDSVVPDQYIIILASDVVDAAGATQRLVGEHDHLHCQAGHGQSG
ncbi:MAG: hypothetical protein P8Y26_12295, partial [Gemmatimonadales bacterium]